GTALSVLNTLPRESYLRGVVPQEMPSSWAAEALEAQAVVARSYSLAVGGHCSWLGGGGPERVLCADVRDQVYGGKSAEQPATNAAVLATAGEVVTHDGRPAETYFFSTSGGRTAAKADEWGGAAVPYLVSVPDPYDALSPHHLWGPGDAELDCSGTSADCVFRAVQVRQLLGLAALPLDLAVTGRNASRRVSALTASTAAGAATFDGAVARRRLGLRSTWFSVGVLSLRASTRTVTYGQRVTLAGLTRGGGTRGWRGASLQRRRAGETSWSTIAATLADGIWSSRRAPGIGTDFRVVSGNATGAAVRVNVRTRVAFETPEPPYTRLTGRIGPARAGVAVTLERREADGTWALVARTKTTTEGGFSFALLRRGTYRATADAGPGYQPGRASASLPPR
ncbi:MAG: SpoIID/LytB domain-containing protein, partial [Thermoleophilia bacterium]|nr:SpoIID/LytB domain-containing protein [Thermoleophilia bacterium]